MREIKCQNCGCTWKSSNNRVMQIPAYIECPLCKKWAGEPFIKTPPKIRIE